METEALEKETSEELVKGIKSGCSPGEYEERFRILVTRLQRRLLGCAYRMAQDPDVAEELVSETWEGFLMSLARYDPGRARVFTWLFSILEHKWLGHLGKAIHEQQMLEQLAREMPHDAPGPARACTCRVLSHDCWQHVLSLPARLRAPFVLVYIEGRTYREAARVLDVPLRTCENRVFAALRQLRRYAPGLRRIMSLVD